MSRFPSKRPCGQGAPFLWVYFRLLRVSSELMSVLASLGD